MKIMALSTTTDVVERLAACEDKGYITFIYRRADPKMELLRDKFLYVRTDEELTEKITLLKQDVTIQDLILQ